MTRNRLTAAANEGWSGQAPAQSLEEFCDTLNARHFTKQMGVEYFITDRVFEGRHDRVIERRTVRTGTHWKPNQRELSALSAVVSRHSRDQHLTQEQFNSLVRRGVIDRQMEAEMNTPRDRAA